jgi:hypothetical protein
VAVACYLPGRAKDLQALPRSKLDSDEVRWTELALGGHFRLYKSSRVV